MAKKYQSSEEQGEPLVDKTTPGLYRDEGFWEFHYWDPIEREQAIQEYNEFFALDACTIMTAVARVPVPRLRIKPAMRRVFFLCYN